jgi:glutathione S-transferase
MESSTSSAAVERTRGPSPAGSPPQPWTLIGRSSSSFTRVTRIFAAELGVPYVFRVVQNLGSLDTSDYGGHPGLKVPSLQTPEGTWFGSANVARRFAAHAGVPRHVIWPEALDRPISANAQELTLSAMSTEVALIMSTLGSKPGEAPADSAHCAKMRKSLIDTLVWLDANVEGALDALPAERELSYLEVTLFCLLEHLEFRKILSITPYPSLGAFRARFAQRSSALQTPYRFDT